MASIILSFVGSQDPFAKTDTEGSIVTLVKHLLQEKTTIRQVILLHTTGTEQNAIDTKAWLESDPVNFAPESVDLMPVDDRLSNDPVNLLLAVEAARSGLERAIADSNSEDILEFNASSGTPVMKSSWSILQAAGYVPRSHVWQVRNPKEMGVDQIRVFKTDVGTLRKEFDLKIIKQQIEDYNYSGALTTLQASGLETATTLALLNYGYYRFSLDFDRAFSSLNPVSKNIDTQWIQEISALRQKDRRLLLREVYFNALIRLKNKQYAEFLVKVFGLQENLLFFLVCEKMGLQISSSPSNRSYSLNAIREFDQGRLYQYLQQCRVPSGGELRLDSITRYVLIAILEYNQQFTGVLQLIKELNDYCDRRNDVVHEFIGVSKIEDEAKLLSILRKLMRQVIGVINDNPFDRLNDQICERLDRSI